MGIVANVEGTARSGLIIFRRFDLPSILSGKINHMNLKVQKEVLYERI